MSAKSARRPLGISGKNDTNSVTAELSAFQNGIKKPEAKKLPDFFVLEYQNIIKRF